MFFQNLKNLKNQPKGTNSTPRAHTPTGAYPTRGGPGAASPREHDPQGPFFLQTLVWDFKGGPEPRPKPSREKETME